MENKKNEQQVKFEAYLKNLFEEKDKPTSEELTQWAWNFKVGSALQIDLIDAKTNDVKIRYIGKEFRVTMIDKNIFNETFGLIEDILYTTLLLGCDSMTDDERTELLFKFNRFKTLLEEQYFNGQENYKNVVELIRNSIINSLDFKFPNTPSNSSNPTYIFNNISPEDAERIIKEAISNNKGSIEINFH